MAEMNGSLQLTPDPESQFLPLSPRHPHPDPNFSANQKLQLTTDSYFMERGTRYKAYAHLRESKLRSRRLEFDEDERESKIPRSEITPPAKKSVRFQGSLPRKQGRSVLSVAQSVPDFSLAVRKENRKPPPENSISRIPVPRAERSVMTTPPSSVSRRESKSVNAGEKQSGGRVVMMLGRKSYASMEELKGLSIATSNAINGENRGGKRVNVLRKSSVFSTRYY